MKISELSQEHINENVATTKDFWIETYKSLNAPFHPWKDLRNESFVSFFNICNNTKDLPSNLEYVLFEFPLLKGEFILSWANAMVLTNYRLIMKDQNTGLHNIPLTDLIHYGDKEFGEKWYEKTHKEVVEYKKDENIIQLEWISLIPELVIAAKSRNEAKILNEIQCLILNSSFYELKRSNENFSIPKINWKKSVKLLDEINNQPQEEYSKTFSHNNDSNDSNNSDSEVNHKTIEVKPIKKGNVVVKLVAFTAVIALVVFLYYKFSGNSCEGHEDFIKSAQIKRAKKMNMTINSISVEYIGDCKYKVNSDIFDPGSALSSAQTINNSIIYKWENNNYVFVSNN